MTQHLEVTAVTLKNTDILEIVFNQPRNKHLQNK